MIPAQPQTIKQSLNKAYGLIKPKRANTEEFRASLVKLLGQIDKKSDGESVTNYVDDLLAETYFDPNYSEPENNSSPVCYAAISGWRDGFDDSFLPENKSADTTGKSPPDTFLSGSKAINLILKEAIQVTKMCIWQIATNWQECPQANTSALQKQIDELVYHLLYELTPEEITAVEEC